MFLLVRKNGTSKTGAFTIPGIECIDPTKNPIQAVISVRTRELALQKKCYLYRTF
jgi:ATP-dependent RNA helicase DDX6/DHH1